VKSVLISIQPKWCELIANGKKTVEVRKTKPKLDTPFKVYIYCTQGVVWADYCHFVKGGRGKVIGEFVCNEITVAERGSYCVLPKSKTMLDELDLLEYADGKPIYGWHISDLVIYDKPKELSEFWKLGKCPYAYGMLCTYEGHCYRAGQEIRCGETLTRPPQSWCYVEELG
jgi:predicted transcriptional regulator